MDAHILSMLIVALDSKNVNIFLLLNMILNSNKNNYLSVSGCLAKLPDDVVVPACHILILALGSL